MLSLLLMHQASGAAYYFLDSGTRAIGRGGAFVVGADDLSAQYYNPAALTHIDQPMLNINLWALNQYIAFERMDIDTGSCIPSCEEVTNQSPPMVEPSLGYAIPLGPKFPALEGSVVALGFYVPTSPTMSFDPDGAQRYALIESLVWQVYAGPSIALHTPKIPWLTVGGGLEYTFLRANESLAVSAILDGDGAAGSGAPIYSDAPTSDVVLDLKSWDPVQFSWNAGVIIKPVEWLEFGGSVQPPINYNAPGSLHVEFNEDHLFNQFLSESTADDDDVRLEVALPWVIRTGFQIRPHPKVRVEGDFVWTNWSKTGALKITNVDLTLRTKDGLLQSEDITITDDVLIPTGFDNAWSVRAGGDWQATDWLKVSLGAHYESSAVPTARQGVSVVDSPKWGIGAGGSFNVGKRLTLDASFAEQFLSNRTITDSDLRQITLQVNPFDSTDAIVDEGLVVGNGHFNSRLTFAGIGATVKFGEPHPAKP